MSDLISREALLLKLTDRHNKHYEMWKAFKNHMGNRKTIHSTQMGECKNIIDIIVKEPAVTDTNVGCKWIPCSERLPEEFSDYLATLEGGDVEILEYDTYFYEWNDVHGHTLNNEHVIAWMPLPEPYKGE